MNKTYGKALEAADAARQLFASTNFNGSANRAYYAMFDCARLLLHLRHAFKPRTTKKHATTIEQFSLFFVKSGVIESKHGRALRDAFEARAMADYSDDSISAEHAKKLISDMDAFLAAVAPFLHESSPS